ncbi:MAG TPA: alpha-ketoglutarate-dependent dioxygenase AlkB [Thermoanaerobaculia bacterium]|jgi:alkylated DNA repair dioxygenase AlkB|nr:alpha-ketoglutarate-dependent dioxygenase AlkB [Thermoanaerobaculia bacterium]
MSPHSAPAPGRRSSRSAAPPEGFRYLSDLLAPEDESGLIARIRELPLKEFEFQGYIAKRRVVYYGWQYSYGERRLGPAEAIPEFLLPLRERAASFAGLAAADLVQALVAEYRRGTPIGWHRDKPMFGDVVGVSLLSPCVLRFRRRTGPSSWERHSLTAEPRSAYLLSGPARNEWEHSIPAVAALRYSVTFRTLAKETIETMRR